MSIAGSYAIPVATAPAGTAMQLHRRPPVNAISIAASRSVVFSLRRVVPQEPRAVVVKQPHKTAINNSATVPLIVSKASAHPLSSSMTKSSPLTAAASLGSFANSVPAASSRLIHAIFARANGSATLLPPVATATAKPWKQVLIKE